MPYNHKKCEDEDDAKRMAETILRELGYTDIQLGTNRFDVSENLSKASLLNIARNCERIARWARAEAYREGNKNARHQR